jgi:hypothetical protein
MFTDRDIKKNGMVDVWDLGPERPTAPNAPVEPKKTGRAADDALAMQQHEDAVTDYKKELAHYAGLKREFDEHRTKIGGAMLIEAWPTDANEWVLNHSNRYVKELPPGIRPGKAHDEAVEVQAKRTEEIARMKERDPHMGSKKEQS